jgi:hypothetical protein
MNMTWYVHAGLKEILNHNNQSSPLLVIYVCSKLQTQSIHCIHKWQNSLSHTLPHSHCINTFVLWLCQDLGDYSLIQASYLGVCDCHHWLSCFLVQNLCRYFRIGFMKYEVVVSSAVACVNLGQCIRLEVMLIVIVLLLVPLILVCQHDVWSALNIWAVMVMLFGEECVWE